jgi:LuxR family maltose regulon positive regulatory protein
MAGPLLETKLQVPRPRRDLVARPRLSERLSRGAESALTLVSAPAGFGKTTLLADWLATTAAKGRSAAWLSLDQRDNDPALFWTYLVAALKTAAPGVGADALSLLQSPQPPIEAVVATLLNDLSAFSNDVVLVLDDYHLIDAREVQDGMAFLLEHLPPQIHLVIAGRADPALQLARLRGRGELIEVRAADLRFTPEEVAAYLNGAMGLALTAQDVAVLEGRTEGWIAALQMAALSMQGRDDVAGFIAGFAGDDRYIVDYLAEEVLKRQPEHVQHFLLQTSILDRLSGPLCDAVTGQDGGKATLAALERGNLFLMPLDDHRRWYRYHRLFADVLQAHLLDERPDDVPELHRRASDWYEHNEDRFEAVGHALAGEDFERAADLIELAIPALHQGRQDATLRRWLAALPDEVIRVRPVMSVALVGVLMSDGELEGVEARLRDAERWLDWATKSGPGREAPSAAMVVVDEVAFRRLPGAIAMYRAGHAQVRGDVAGVLTHAPRALELADEDDHVGHGAAAALLGLAYWTSGDLAAAHRWYAEGMASLAKAGHVADVIGGAITLADIQIVQGRLGEATSLYEEGLQRATEHGAPALRGAADMHVGISQLRYERNDLDDAMQHLRMSRDLGEHAGFPQNRYRWRVAMARIRQVQGDPGGALDLLNEAERLYAGDFSPNVRPVPALRARLWVAQGRLNEALGWARERDLSVEDDLGYLHEFEHITLARVLLARYAAERAGRRPLDEATRLLRRLLRAAEDGGRTGSAIEILVLQALAHQAPGDIPTALASLQRALTLAQPEGYVRVFVDEGPPMAALLKAAWKQGIAPNYVRRLLTAINNTEGTQSVQQGLIEPLSERELDVLRLLGSDLGGPDIARQLIVSLNTVRTHTNHVYAKLGVNNRRAAVRRARELGLLSRTREP